jgi:hypothetical protein
VDSIEPNEPVLLHPEKDETAQIARTTAHAVSARPQATQTTMMIVGGAGVLAGIACVLAFGWLRGDAPVQTAVAASPATTAPTKPVAAAVVESGPEPTWRGQGTASWAPDGSRTISFELPATREVPVWMSRVRPLLVVRCLSRTTQAFVVIGTSASFEDDNFRRTVRLQFDDAPETAQQWQTSESGQELFAPDGAAFVRQLVHGQRLRFGFTPFNAQPVTAEFAVQGFEPLAGLVAKTCGWRL